MGRLPIPGAPMVFCGFSCFNSPLLSDALISIAVWRGFCQEEHRQKDLPFGRSFLIELVIHVDALGWASFCAFAAVGAFFWVDVCAVVSYGDSAELTGAFTFFAAQTAVGANFSGAQCVLFGTAGYPGLLSSRDDFHDIL